MITILKIWILLNMAVVALLVSGPGRAQEQQPAPRERALLARLSQEINNTIACGTEVGLLQDRIKELEGRLALTGPVIMDKKAKP